MMTNGADDMELIEMVTVNDVETRLAKFFDLMDYGDITRKSYLSSRDKAKAVLSGLPIHYIFTGDQK